MNWFYQLNSNNYELNNICVLLNKHWFQKVIQPYYLYICWMFLKEVMTAYIRCFWNLSVINLCGDNMLFELLIREQKRMLMQMEDFQNKMKDIQFMKVTREIQLVSINSYLFLYLLWNTVHILVMLVTVFPSEFKRKWYDNEILLNNLIHTVLLSS